MAEFLFKYLPCVTVVDARHPRPGRNVPHIMGYEQIWDQVEIHWAKFKVYGFSSDVAERESGRGDPPRVGDAVLWLPFGDRNDRDEQDRVDFL